LLSADDDFIFKRDFSDFSHCFLCIV